MIKILINPNYKFISSSLYSIIDPDFFKRQGELLFTSRNTIKRFCLGGIDIVVKRYGHITSFNRLMYSTFRKSKAMRAYQHASQLRELGISTPEEIAMIETYKNGILQDCYFVSASSSYHSMAFLRDEGFNRESMYPLIDAMVEWIVKLHDKGILHQDLNVGNILYQEQHDGSINFQLIDINRMKFRTNLSVEERLKELSRLSTNLDLHLYLLRKYAELMKYDGNQIETKGCFYKIMFEFRQTIKRKIKGYLSSSFKRYCNGEIPR